MHGSSLAAHEPPPLAGTAEPEPEPEPESEPDPETGLRSSCGAHCSAVSGSNPLNRTLSGGGPETAAAEPAAEAGMNPMGSPPGATTLGGDTEDDLLRFVRLPVSNCCSGVLTALLYKGVPFTDCEPPGAHFSEPLGQWRPGYGSTEYKRLVPMGTIPAVLQPPAAPGRPPRFSLSESATICEWLEDSFPQPPLLPSQPDRRARLRFALRYHDLHIDPHVKSLFRHCDPRQRDEEALEATAAQLSDKLRQFDRQVVEVLGRGALGDQVFDGEAFSLVDCCLPPTLLLMERLASVLLQRSLLPPDSRLQRWLGAVVTQPSLASVVAEAAVATDAWVERKQSADDAAFERGWWNIGRENWSAGGVGGADEFRIGIDREEEEEEEEEEDAEDDDIVALVATPSAKESVRCPVCLAPMADAASLPCGHSGCLGCLQLAVAHNKKCPVCRASHTPGELSINVVLCDHVERLERSNPARAAELTAARRDHAIRLLKCGLAADAMEALRRAAAGAPTAELKVECEAEAMAMAPAGQMRFVQNWRFDFKKEVITGCVYNYPGHEDGSAMSTSRVRSASASGMTTESRSTYALGEVDPFFQRELEAHLQAIGASLLDMENEPLLVCLLKLDSITRARLAQKFEV